MGKKHKSTVMSCNKFPTHLVKSLLRRYHEFKMIRQYIRAYKQTPETKEEAETFLRIASIALADDPWE